jgi:hypothetical protein
MLLNHRQQSASNFRVEVKASQPPFADLRNLPAHSSQAGLSGPTRAHYLRIAVIHHLGSFGNRL